MEPPSPPSGLSLPFTPTWMHQPPPRAIAKTLIRSGTLSGMQRLNGFSNPTFHEMQTHRHTFPREAGTARPTLAEQRRVLITVPFFYAVVEASTQSTQLYVVGDIFFGRHCKDCGTCGKVLRSKRPN